MVDFNEWFLAQRDPRVAEGFHTVLHEDFFHSYLHSDIQFSSHRLCSVDALCDRAGESLRPHLTYLPGLAELIGRMGVFVPSWVFEFYATLWIHPSHQYIHFSFRGRQFRLQSSRIREIFRLSESLVCLHVACYGDTEPPRRPHSGLALEMDMVRDCFLEGFGEGSSWMPKDLTPTARILDAIVCHTILP